MPPPMKLRPMGRLQDDHGTGKGTVKNSIVINVYRPADDRTVVRTPEPPPDLPTNFVAIFVGNFVGPRSPLPAIFLPPYFCHHTRFLPNP